MYGTKNSSLMTSKPEGLKALQIFRSIITACAACLLGMGLGFMTVAVPQIKGTIDEISWFASICGFVAPLGSIVNGVIIDKFGRRAALLWGIVPGIFAWTIIWLCENMTIILIGRALYGLSIGALAYGPQVYAAECIFVHHQRLLDSFKMWTGITGFTGALLCLLLSFYLNYRQLAAVLLAITVVELSLIFTFLPESPIWMISQGRYGDAEWLQKRLGLNRSILDEDSRKNFGVETILATPESKYSWESIKSYCCKIKRKDVYKPLSTTLLFFVLMQASGVFPLTVFMVNIIGNRPTQGKFSAESDIKTSDSLQFTTISFALSLSANVLMSFILPYISLRKLVIPCLSVMAISLTVLGYCTVAQDADLYMVRVVSVWLIAIVSQTGLINLPGALLGYIFPVDAKGFASGASAVFLLLSAVATKLHPYLENAYHGYLYYGYAMFALLCGIHAYFCMPEVVGRNQKEISTGFETKM